MEAFEQLLAKMRASSQPRPTCAFSGSAPSSLDVDIFAYILARDWNHFLQIQGALLLQCMDCVGSCGLALAIPASLSITRRHAAGSRNIYWVPPRWRRIDRDSGSALHMTNVDRETARLQEARGGNDPLEKMGAVSHRTPMGHGSGRLQSPTATPGTISLTIRRVRAHITGARTAWPASATTTSGFASRWRCGTARIRS